jgi:hypothetical protein
MITIFNLPLTFLSDLVKYLNTIDCLNLVTVLESAKRSLALKKTNYFNLLINQE